MDIDVIHSGLLSIGITAAKMRAERPRLAAADAAEISEFLARAELDLKVAEATIARELGFQLCQHCWPPELITHSPREPMRCRNCHRGVYARSLSTDARDLQQFELRRAAVALFPAENNTAKPLASLLNGKDPIPKT